MRKTSWLPWVLSLALASAAFAQSTKFQPGANPVSNQAYDFAAVTPGTPWGGVSRAIYNGSAATCNFTAISNAGTSVAFTNNQPGEYNPIQATVVTATSCTSLVVLY